MRFSNLAGHDKHGCHFSQKAEAISTAEYYLSRVVKSSSRGKSSQVLTPITVSASVPVKGVELSVERTIPPPLQSR